MFGSHRLGEMLFFGFRYVVSMREKKSKDFTLGLKPILRSASRLEAPHTIDLECASPNHCPHICIIQHPPAEFV